MTDTPEAGAETAAQPQQPPAVKMQILGQYIRDLSFENVLMQKGVNGEVSPEIQVQGFAGCEKTSRRSSVRSHHQIYGDLEKQR